MDGIEEKLSALFSSPESMEQIRKLAESLSGSGGTTQNENASQNEDSKGAGEDSGLMQTVMRVIQASSSPNETTRLIHALSPWLSRGRAEKLEKAVKIARLTTAARNILPNLSVNIQ